MKKIDVVITYYNEDLSWINDLNKKYINKIFIYNKSGSDDYIPIENIGLDTHTILFHIVKHYDNLSDNIVFLQGNPFDHQTNPYNVNDINKWFEELQTLDHTTNYHISPLDSGLTNGKVSYWKRPLKDTGYDIKTWMNRYLNIDKSKKNAPIYWAAQFGVSKDKILKNPITFYEELLSQHDSKWGEISHFMERSFGLIFNIDGLHLHNRNNFGEFLTFHNLNKKGVEIGSFKGEYTGKILNAWNGILYMVDPWRPLGDEYIDMSNHKNHNMVYSEAIDNITGFEDRAIMIRTISEKAVDLFEDESLDFVYIDGNHAYEYVKQDIELWYPKVKKGGLVSGHDYILFDGNIEGWYKDENFAEDKINKHIWSPDRKIYYGLFGVNPAVDEFCKNNNYEFKTSNEWSSTWYFFKR